MRGVSMSERIVTPASVHPKLSAEERDWIRRQARSTRALAAEQYRSALRAGSDRRRFSGGANRPKAGS